MAELPLLPLPYATRIYEIFREQGTGLIDSSRKSPENCRKSPRLFIAYRFGRVWVGGAGRGIGETGAEIRGGGWAGVGAGGGGGLLKGVGVTIRFYHDRIGIITTGDPKSGGGGGGWGMGGWGGGDEEFKTGS